MHCDDILKQPVDEKIRPRFIDHDDELFHAIQRTFYPATHYRHLGHGTGGHVFGVDYQGQEVAVKMCNRNTKSAWKETNHEAAMYHHLRSFQGTILLTVIDFVEWRQIDYRDWQNVIDDPELQRLYEVRHRAIIFKEVGEELKRPTTCQEYHKIQAQWQTLEPALYEVAAHSIDFCDLHWRNLICYQDRVIAIDLELSVKLKKDFKAILKREEAEIVRKQIEEHEEQRKARIIEWLRGSQSE